MKNFEKNYKFTNKWFIEMIASVINWIDYWKSFQSELTIGIKKCHSFRDLMAHVVDFQFRN